MKKLLYTLILSALGVMPYGLKAQTPNQALPDSTLEAMMLYEGFSNNLDSLLNLWYIQQALDTNNFVDGVDIDSVGIHSNIPDSVYINRLAQINSIIDLP